MHFDAMKGQEGLVDGAAGADTRISAVSCMHQTWPLIGPDDPAPVEVYRPTGKAPLLLVADHAGRAIPPHMGKLGLHDSDLDLHIAYDIGICTLTRRLADLLDAPAVLGVYSRLLIDPNRGLARADSIPEVSDSVPIPGNKGLSETDRRQRAESFYWPFQNAVAAMLETQRARHGNPAFIAVHSFTPIFQGVPRPWHVGVLWGDDPDTAMPFLRALTGIDGLCVGDNEPYDGREDWGGTVHRHAVPLGLPHCAIEVRQDLIDDEQGANHWAELLTRVMVPLLR